MDKKWYQDWSWLGYLNFFILQWFFIRLGKFGYFLNDKFIRTRWKILYWVIPLTGWWNIYKYKGKKKYYEWK